MTKRLVKLSIALFAAAALIGSGCSSEESTARISRLDNGSTEPGFDPSDAPDDPQLDEAPDDSMPEGPSDQPGADEPTSPPPSSPSATYPQVVRDSFVTACQTNGGAEVCTCALDYIEQHATLEEFSKLEQEFVNSGELPALLQDAVEACN